MVIESNSFWEEELEKTHHCANRKQQFIIVGALNSVKHLECSCVESVLYT